MHLQKFDEMIDTVQRATCMQINERQKKLLNKNMILNQNLNMEEMRRALCNSNLKKDVRRNGVLFSIEIRS